MNFTWIAADKLEIESGQRFTDGHEIEILSLEELREIILQNEDIKSCVIEREGML